MNRIYHGHASPADLQSCRDALPGVTHGLEWSDPERVPTDRDEPFILDNGAYSAALAGDQWSATQWYDSLAVAHRLPREPDFVVLPDVYGDADKTRLRHERYVEVVRSHGFDYYSVAQPGHDPAEHARFAEAIGAYGLFVGGPQWWKREKLTDLREETSRRSLQLHIGQPGDLVFANEVGADSVDTTSIVRNDAYHKLTELNEQQSLTEASGGAQ